MGISIFYIAVFIVAYLYQSFMEFVCWCLAGGFLSTLITCLLLGSVHFIWIALYIVTNSPLLGWMFVFGCCRILNTLWKTLDDQAPENLQQ